MKNILKTTLTILLSATYTLTSQGAAYTDERTYDTAPTQIYTGDGYTILDYTAMTKPQEGADCGLHSLKNSIALFNYLQGTTDITERNRQLQSDTLGNLGNMTACRTKLGVASRYLDPEELTTLTKDLNAPYNIPLKDNKLLILDNLLNPYITRTDEYNYQLAEIVENLQNGTSFTHAFVLGNMNELAQRAGHWIAGVIKRDYSGGPITLHLANTTLYIDEADIREAIFTYDRTIGQQLMNHLRQLNPRNLRLQAIQNLREELNKNINISNFSAALINIRDIIDQAIQQNILTHQAFEQEYRPFLQNILNKIPTDFLTNEELERKLYLFNFLNFTYNPIAWKPINTTQSTPETASSQNQSPSIVQALRSKIYDWWYGSPVQPETSAHTQEADILLAERLALEELRKLESKQAAIKADEELARALAEMAD